MFVDTAHVHSAHWSVASGKAAALQQASHVAIQPELNTLLTFLQHRKINDAA
jgi:hypothetical protein